MENKFLTFFKPYLQFIDDGDFFRKPFSWLYSLLAIINLLFPIAVLVQAIDKGLFDVKATVIIVFILIWLLIAFAGWLSFQIWWDRKSKIKMSSSSGDDFIATPVFSHFIQTLGEWLGSYIAIVGFGFALLVTILLGSDGYMLSRFIGLPILETGWGAIIAMPIIGFLLIVFSRFLSEQIRALAAIANNTKK